MVQKIKVVVVGDGRVGKSRALEMVIEGARRLYGEENVEVVEAPASSGLEASEMVMDEAGVLPVNELEEDKLEVPVTVEEAKPDEPACGVFINILEDRP